MCAMALQRLLHDASAATCQLLRADPSAIHRASELAAGLCDLQVATLLNQPNLVVLAPSFGTIVQLMAACLTQSEADASTAACALLVALSRLSKRLAKAVQARSAVACGAMRRGARRWRGSARAAAWRRSRVPQAHPRSPHAHMRAHSTDQR